MHNPFNKNEGNRTNPFETDFKKTDNTQWNGDCYRYSNPKENFTQTHSEPNVPHCSAEFVKTPKKKHSGKIVGKVIAAVLVCTVISAGSIGTFVALVNNGVVKFNNGQNLSNPAFTITKIANGSNTNNVSTSVGELTKQQIAEKVIPSVVCIQNYQINKNALYTFGSFGSNGQKGSDESAVTPASEGSGIIASSDGYIITNAHVVDGASSLKVILSDGKSYEAKLIGSDKITDLAVIKINAPGLKAAEFGSSKDLKVADTVMAVGNPGGMEFNSSVTIGYISALNRMVPSNETGCAMKCIQTDAAINPGNSGGALVNMYGQVIGINSSKIVAEEYEGLGFSIPIDEAQPIISDLKQFGYVKDRAVLGIMGQFIDKMTASFYGLPAGMYVDSVTSQAVKDAGIKRGDVITKIDGKDVISPNTVTGIVSSKKPGETVTLNVIRGITNETFTVKVKLSQSTGK